VAAPTWPSCLPFENEAGGATSGANYVLPIESETEGGPPLMRPRPGPRSTEVTWRSQPLTEEQWLIFEKFARDALYRGTLVFSMPVFKPGEGYMSRMCQLRRGDYATDYSEPPWYRVSFTLIVWNW
jgi:hypothetical protein